MVALPDSYRGRNPSAMATGICSTREIDIRTLARIPFQLALCDSGPVPVYQRIAPEVARLHAQGRSFVAIARTSRP